MQSNQCQPPVDYRCASTLGRDLPADEQVLRKHDLADLG